MLPWQEATMICTELETNVTLLARRRVNCHIFICRSVACMDDTYVSQAGTGI